MCFKDHTFLGTAVFADISNIVAYLHLSRLLIFPMKDKLGISLRFVQTEKNGTNMFSQFARFLSLMTML